MSSSCFRAASCASKCHSRRKRLDCSGDVVPGDRAVDSGWGGRTERRPVLHAHDRARDEMVEQLVELERAALARPGLAGGSGAGFRRLG